MMSFNRTIFSFGFLRKRRRVIRDHTHRNNDDNEDEQEEDKQEKKHREEKRQTAMRITVLFKYLSETHHNNSAHKYTHTHTLTYNEHVYLFFF
jgi:hypothetical protein